MNIFRVKCQCLYGCTFATRYGCYMFVPTDAALTEYWENGAGKVLKDRYGAWENVPDKVLSSY